MDTAIAAPGILAVFVDFTVESAGATVRGVGDA